MLPTKAYATPNVRALVARLLSDTLKNGGSTLSPRTGNAPDPAVGRYLVGGQAEELIIFETEARQDFDRAVTRIVDHYREHYQRLAAVNTCTYVGGWVDEGKVYIDLSNLFERQSTAECVAKRRNEIAYFDLHSGQSIDIRNNN